MLIYATNKGMALGHGASNIGPHYEKCKNKHIDNGLINEHIIKRKTTHIGPQQQSKTIAILSHLSALYYRI